MFFLENEFIKIRVSPKGAELQSIVDKRTGQEFMWEGNPAVWGKHSPVLFPIVGTLKNNSYFFNEQEYHLPRHGFARDREFELSHQSNNSLSLVLKSDANTLKVFPFYFEFYMDYSITNLTLSVSYRVKNSGSSLMYFSVGGHPAFRIPIFEGDAYEDYILEFNQLEQAERWPISPNGLIEMEGDIFLENDNKINLKKSLFNKDAIVLKHLNSNTVKLISKKNNLGFEFDFTGFPFLGIWAAKDADFVCIEPWCGIADSVNKSQQLIAKEGIQCLNPDEVFLRTWSVTIL
ncbi:MAG: aldose 1-epimerase family protein [Niabella sp.]|nr:MAG: aldose 1-epimerase family protein [Niabella sp.]